MSPREEAGRLRPETPPDLSAAQREMLADVVAGLGASPKTLPSKYFYDEVGSRLFDEITELDEYYLTRTETAIMEDQIAAMVAALGPDVLLVEFGSGASVKTRILLDHLDRPVGYIPIDISGEYLGTVAETLREHHPEVPILPLVADFTGPLTLPAPPRPPARRVVYFPGSTIGNFPLLRAARLLARMRSMAGPHGLVLIGFDLVKPLDRLHAAYDDAQGVTARFNLNLLARLNRELGGDFDLEAFRHHAPFNAEASRIEMHLESLSHQTMRVGGHTFTMEPGETILTEFSHKYTLDAFEELADSAGLAAVHSWTDPEEFFCVQLLRCVNGPAA